MPLVINSVCVELFLLLVANLLIIETIKAPPPKKKYETFASFSSDDSLKG